MELFTSTGNWIVALGKTLIHSIWIALLILSLLRLILNSMADRNSELRYRVAVLSMLLFIGSVTASFLLIFSPEHLVQAVSETGGNSFLFSLVMKDNSPVQLAKNPYLVFIFCSYLYFAAIPVLLIRSAASLRYLRKMKESGTPVQDVWYRRFELLKRSLGIHRRVTLMETESLKVPALIGFLKPVILVPAGMFSNLSLAQVETILMHELYHLRRFDSIANVIQLFFENLFFYNPALWGISRIIRNEREKCCDDRVLDSCADPLSYAKALYKLAGQKHQFTHLVTGAGGTDQYQLFTRIKRILNQKTMKNNIREKLFSLLILASGVLIMLTVTGFSSGFSIVKDKESWQNPINTEVFDTIPEVENEVEDEVEHEDIDWEEIKEEMEEARIEAMEALEEIDWEGIREEMEEARMEALEEIDWEEIREELAKTKIYLDSLKMDMDFDFDFDMDIDMEKIQEEVNSSLEDINWEEIEAEMARVRVRLDSVFRDMDFDFDVDVD